MTTEAVDWRSRPTINVEEAGQILGVGRSTAYTLARNGQLPTLRLGRKFLVPTATLRRMLGEMDRTTNQSPVASQAPIPN